MTAVPFYSRTPPAPPSLTTGSPEELAFGLLPALNACGSISSEFQASSILSNSWPPLTQHQIHQMHSGDLALHHEAAGIKL